MKFSYLLVFLLFCFHISVNAQNKIIFKGKITHSDENNVEAATITLKGVKKYTFPSNDNGDFNISIEKGTYQIKISSINSESYTSSIKLSKDTTLNFVLTPYENILEGVEVRGVKERDAVKSNQTGIESIKMSDIEKIPVLLGEKDILKTLQLKPGVSAAGDGNSGFYVRGGSADQNLILLDKQQIFNASHLLGFFSIFNADAISELTLYKGTQPSNFGGRLSSVLDVTTNPGDDQEYHAKGGIGLISSRLSVSGPIQKGKGSFNISGRRTYADVFLKLSSNEDLKKSILNFYDLNAAGDYDFNKKNRVTFSAYMGRDNFGLKNAFGISWGNKAVSINSFNQISEKIKSTSSLIYTNFNYGIYFGSSEERITLNSGVENYNIKQRFDYNINKNNQLYFGFDASRLNVYPQDVTNPTKDNTTPTTSKALDNALFVGDEWNNLGKFNINYGLRISSFSLLGGRKYYKYDVNGNTDAILDLSKQAFAKTYWNIEPRFSASYVINDNNSLKFFYGRNTQNIHVLSNSSSGSPTDVYLLSSYNIKPEISDQFSFGYFNYFKNRTYELGVETYYKKMDNQLDYKSFTDINGEGFSESSLLYGMGRAYGLEFYIQKKKGRLTGWIGYTLSRTERKINGINNDQYYPARQDRTHDISVVAMYDISKRWNIAATWIYTTGNATTYPTAKYMADGNFVYYYSNRNQYRMPAYHRMDVSVNYKGKMHKRFQSEWNFSVFNLYNRKNAYSIDFINDENHPNTTLVRQTALFGIVPSVTYNFKF